MVAGWYMYTNTIWLTNTGDQDVGGRRDTIRYLLAAAARVHRSHRLQAGHHRVRDCLAETLLRCRLLGCTLAGDEQQLPEPSHLWIST